MALDPRISLAAQAPNLQTSIRLFDDMKNSQLNRAVTEQQMKQQAEQFPLLQQHRQQSIDANAQGLLAGEQQQQVNNENRVIRSIAEFAPTIKPLLEQALKTGDTAGAQTALTKRLTSLMNQGLPTNETVDALTALRSGNIDETLGYVNQAEQIAKQRGLMGTQLTASQKEFESATQGLSDEDKLKARRIGLGLEPRAGISAQERIAIDPNLTTTVAKSQAEIKGAQEEAKFKKEVKFKPTIAKAVKLAEAEAKEKGEVLTDLARMEASLPGVREVVDQLVDLSAVATSTLGGRAFDALVKESGFGSTKGADARAKMVAIVDNQVLPLLKETFGAAFTVQEGENLKASLVDPNASPSAKRAQLEAFLAQKERNVRTKQTQLSSGQQRSGGQLMIDANGNRAIVYPDGTIEEQ
jgi:hypothetical protein